MKYDSVEGKWYILVEENGEEVFQEIDRLDALRIIETNGDVHFDGVLCSFASPV